MNTRKFTFRSENDHPCLSMAYPGLSRPPLDPPPSGPYEQGFLTMIHKKLLLNMIDSTKKKKKHVLWIHAYPRAKPTVYIIRVQIMVYPIFHEKPSIPTCHGK